MIRNDSAIMCTRAWCNVSWTQTSITDVIFNNNIMAHLFDDHLLYLNKLCRICCERSFRNQRNKKTKGKQAKKYERHILCASHKKDILLYFRINIDNDEEGTHSKSLCNKCMMRMYTLKNRALTETSLNAALECASRGEKLWTPFNKDAEIHQCLSCATYLAQNKGCLRAPI